MLFRSSVAKAVAAVKGRGAVWCEVFCGHPTRYRHTDWWDGPFYDGVTPEKYASPPTRPQHLFEACMANLGKSVRKLSEELNVLGLDEVLKLDWTYREPTSEEAAYVREKTAENIRASAGWPPNRRGLDTSRIVKQTLTRLNTVRIAVG